ncbi:MAG: phosphodiester glycosidase family protein [Candidatus Riflebacteria bacterium]|jgi:exopolysaccharide biosynthesis protein|nr:phosphodiester glycosidase family protein [Candidatus Riflebacteria bacterium]
MLLLIGQIFLVGAVLQTEKAIYYDIDDEIDLYDMKYTSKPDSERYVEMLSEDQMPEPATSGEESDADLETVQKKADTAASAPVVLDVSFRSEEAFEIVELTISREVKILRRNQAGKLLRMRILPALQPLNSEHLDSLRGKLNKFSLFHAPSYSEMVFAAGGRIGTPYVVSDNDGGFKLCIPYQQKKAHFALTTGEKIVNGLTYYRDRAKVAGRFADVHILRVEPFADGISVFPALANEGIAQKEVLSSMAGRYNAVAAINGAYFTSRGDPIGTLIINRRLISSPLYKRSVFGVTEDDTLIFGNPDFSGVLRSGKLSVKIDAVNQPRRGNSLVVFTPEYARSTLTDEDGVEMVLVKGKVVGIHEKDALIPPDGVVVSAGGEKASELSQLKLGQSVELDYSIDRPWNTIRHAVCGGPRLIENGRKSINGKEEKFDHSIVHGRHPRTAVAMTFDGDLLLVVVDGRSQRNAGMKLEELADYLRTLGARHAINLDGGGSSSMIVRGRTVNAPSDGRERRISNGILITNR